MCAFTQVKHRTAIPCCCDTFLFQIQHIFCLSNPQGIVNNYKDHLEKSWNEKKDQFGGRQKGNAILSSHVY